MARPFQRRKQNPKHSRFGSLTWVGAEKCWVVKGHVTMPDGRTKRPRLHKFPEGVQTRGQAEYAFGEWIAQQKAEQALHLRNPAGDVRALCREFVERGIEEYRRGDGKVATYWGLDKATAVQWAAMQGDIRLADYDGDHFRAFRDALDKIAAKPKPGIKVRQVTTREGVNKKLKAIRRVVKWGVSRKLCQPGLAEILKAVKGLSEGEAYAQEGLGREACTLEQFDATYPFVPEYGQAALLLLRWSGARPTEVLSLHRDELEYLDDHDMYRAIKAEHKNRKKGKTRTLHFSPAVNQTIMELLRATTKDDPYLFSFSRVVASEPLMEKKKRKRVPIHLQFDVLAYWVENAADAAGVKHWTPYQLRHLRAEEVTKTNKDAAQAMLGHSKATMTANYTKDALEEETRRLAIEAAQVGVSNE